MAQFRSEGLSFEVGKLPEARAREFCAYLSGRGIRAGIAPLEGGVCSVMVGSPEAMRAAKLELLSFTQKDNIEKIPDFTVVRNSGPGAPLHASTAPAPASVLERFRRGGFTTAVELVCAAVFVVGWWDQAMVLEALGLSASFPVEGLTDLYRLLTPAFIHFGILHIAFNLVMWEALGRPVEKTLGTVKLFSLFISIALLSNLLQYEMLKEAGNFFGGMSGVVYGLIGYMAVLSRRPHLPAGLRIAPGLFTVSIIFILIGFFLSGIANFCHLGGLVLGVLWGFYDNYRARAKQGAAM